MTPILAYGAGLGTAGLAYWQRERLKQAYQQVMNLALASHDPKAVAKVAVAFGAAGFPAQAAALSNRASQLTGSGTPNVLRNPSRMMAGEVLQPQLSKTNQSVGRDSRGILTFQTDGNLVLYGPGQTVLWASNTGPKTGVSKLTMQADGNLVIYSNSGQALWNSSTQGNPGAYLVVQGGTAAVMSAQGQPLWTVPAGATATPGGPGGLGMPGMGPGGLGGPGGGYGRHRGGWAQQQALAQGALGSGYPHPHPHHHHPHPWQGQQGQSPMPSPAAAVATTSAPPASGGSGGASDAATSASAPAMAPAATPASSVPTDINPASMVSPSIATDSGGASDASMSSPPPDDSGGGSDVATADTGFGFGFGGFG